MDTLTIPSSIVAASADRRLTPAMVVVVWRIADELDRLRVSETSEALWLTFPSAELRGPGRSDNIWLRECLDRLTGLKLTGEYRGGAWGAVLVAEWKIDEGGARTRILLPPAGITALRAPSTFAKIEAEAAFKLSGHARRLYTLLADRKRQDRPSWTYELEELRRLLGVEKQRSYARFNSFRQRVLDPALADIAHFGTVDLRMTPKRTGRSVSHVRFDWRWKSLDEARETVAAHERPKKQREVVEAADAPPLIPDQQQADAAMQHWHSLTDAERGEWRERIGWNVPGTNYPRKERHMAEAVWQALGPKRSADSLEQPT